MAKSNQSFSVQAARVINEFCRPFRQKTRGLINFMHDITFGKGQIAMLIGNADVFEFYKNNKIPMLCTDDTGRTLAPGVYLNKTLENTYQECSMLMPLLPTVGKTMSDNYGKNSLHMVVRERDCQHLYSLFFDLDENDFLQWIVNNGNFMQAFIAQYNERAKNIMMEAKALENRIILPNSSDFLAKQNTSPHPVKCLSVLHHTMNLPVHLSRQQSICLSLLMQGKSTKQIAVAMQLSPRTVEHYLTKVRKELGCGSSRELIAVYAEQII